ncbi:hypothetical protein MTR67_001347 [Solanum verrucosum]|uniref:Uncharacterized protein n=1 Tax=Solanum verrucosum TaxID=315347 RepID=A0AAF0PNH4_SOLVR|nr:hypothetical protein MTR67_001347 [Solanum verrucosum]
MTRPVDGDTATFGDVILSYSLVLVAKRSAPCVLALGERDGRVRLVLIRLSFPMFYHSWMAYPRKKSQPGQSPIRVEVQTTHFAPLLCSLRRFYIPAVKRERSVIGSIMEIMDMLCHRASLAVSSNARDSTGTKDLN